MRILLLNQAFFPDTVATAQYLTDAAKALAAEAHDVTVITSARAYDDPARLFPARETWRGIDIHRITPLAFGKRSRWRRAADFASFLTLCAAKLAAMPRFDAIVALTSPPLISVLGATAARVKGSRFIFWVMDLNPDEAIAAGWLKPSGLTARLLDRLLRFSLNHGDTIVALDRFMADVIASKGISRDRIEVLPPWCHENVTFDAAGRDEFRRAHAWSDKFVVMYAGNHSPCNPLDTIIAAAEQMRDDPDVVFCFMGGGSVFRGIQQSVAGKLPNVVCLDYQPREALAAALSAADLHVVTMGDPFRGLIHPSKIYNVLKVGAPFLFVGPRPSHVTDIAQAVPAASWCIDHGDVDDVLRAIADARAGAPANDRAGIAAASAPFDASRLLPEFLRIVTQPARSPLAVLQQT